MNARDELRNEPLNDAALTELANVAAASLRRRSRLRPALAIVLGSGFDHFAGRCNKVLEVPYGDLAGFPESRVAGHPGILTLALCAKVPVFILQGRSHYYEGRTLAEITFPIRALAAFGIETVLLTNAAGGISKVTKPGGLMSIRDHINFMGANPLRGWLADAPSGFVDMTAAYDEKLTVLLTRAAKLAKVPLAQGVYLAVSGPSYETPAEIAAFARLGADAVGMSTVPEVIVARQCGLRVAALSCITNAAARRGGRSISHAEVLSVGKSVQVNASLVLENFVKLHAEAP